jgi:hypothetical protein
MPRKKKTDSETIAVGMCSLCEEPRLTFGEQKWGGVRWCQECLKTSLGWFQLDEVKRKEMTILFERIMDVDFIKDQLKLLQNMGDDEKKSISIGESKNRLMEANLAEAQGRW